MSTPRKHAKEIKAWADGIAIQRRSFMTNHEWRDLEDGDEPCFMGSAEWRVKPAPPAKAYPVTTIGHGVMADIYANYLRENLGYENIAVETQGLKAVANAALRHAIDAGQGISAADHQADMTKLSLGLRDFQVERHAARDLAIAEAVRDACLNARYSIPGPDCVDLGAVIAGVK